MFVLLVSKDSTPKIPTRQRTYGIVEEEDFNEFDSNIITTSCSSHRMFDDLDTIPICPTRRCSVEQEEEETRPSRWISNPTSTAASMVPEPRDTSPIKPRRRCSSSETRRSSRLSPPADDENTLMASSSSSGRNRRRKIRAAVSSSQLTSTSTHCKRSRRQQQSASCGPRRLSSLLRNFPSFYSETLDTIDEIECDNDNEVQWGNSVVVLRRGRPCRKTSIMSALL